MKHLYSIARFPKSRMTYGSSLLCAARATALPSRRMIAPARSYSDTTTESPDAAASITEQVAAEPASRITEPPSQPTDKSPPPPNATGTRANFIMDGDKPSKGLIVSRGVTPESFRYIMRKVPQPAVVLTALHFPPPHVVVKHRARLLEQENAVAATEGQSEEIESREDQSEAAKAPEEEAKQSGSPRIVLQPTLRGMTIGSLSSLSLQPQQRVAFNITLPSRTFEAIKSTRRFNIHILDNSPNGAEVAKQFSQGHSNLNHQKIEGLTGYKALKSIGITIGNAKSRFRAMKQYMESIPDDNTITDEAAGQLGYEASHAANVPMLSSNAVLYVLRCDVAKPTEDNPAGGLIKIDEHSAIVIGNVHSFLLNDQPRNSTGLMYANKEYRIHQNSEMPPKQRSQPANFRKKAKVFNRSPAANGKPSGSAEKADEPATSQTHDNQATPQP
ncbi:flavin reductase like domain-containing protein [Xylariales sp. PMI_506]|nr:flavin reductase like domain-containing protein [Xylariales sp. PMI_506]